MSMRARTTVHVAYRVWGRDCPTQEHGTSGCRVGSLGVRRAVGGWSTGVPRAFSALTVVGASSGYEYIPRFAPTAPRALYAPSRPVGVADFAVGGIVD